MIYATQSEGADQGRYIPAKTQNISKKMESVIDWFDGKINFFDDQSRAGSMASTQFDA